MAAACGAFACAATRNRGRVAEMKIRAGLIAFAVLLSTRAGAGLLSVGPGRALKSPSAAAAVAKDGDLIEIDAGDYRGDAAVWSANGLTIRGVNGMARLDAGGKSAQQKAVWIIRGNNTIVENIGFGGCRVPDHNGAGIRHEGAGLTVRHCLFHDNENGILTGANAESDILVEHSEFHHNGFGDGYSHNLYIGRVRSFTMRFSSSHHSKTGHLVKSRAQTNMILCNRLMDEDDGTSSFVIDLPNGGRSFIIGNIIQHGPQAVNRTAVSYAAEGTENAVQELFVVNNTCVNERSPAGDFLRIAGNPARVRVVNNLLVGFKSVSDGETEPVGNLLTAHPGFADAAKRDYRLLTKSPAAGAGVDPGKAGDFDLMPAFYYEHPLASGKRERKEKPDLGACPVASGR